MIIPNEIIFSHEVFGAQFVIGRTRGEGGQVAFSRTSKIRFKTETIVMIHNFETETFKN